MLNINISFAPKTCTITELVHHVKRRVMLDHSIDTHPFLTSLLIYAR